MNHPDLEVIYQFANAPVAGYPFPHCFIRDVFPADFYRELLANLPDDPAIMKPIGEVRVQKGYKDRFVMDLTESHMSSLPEPQKTFWFTFVQWMLGLNIAGALIHKFSPLIAARFKRPIGEIPFNMDGLLIKDTTNYAIGPHSDHPNKVITLLFYLPKDDSQAHLGTSIYIPKQAGFTCPGGPHYPSEQFSKVHTFPFLPNSVFMFCKTDNSFHGVEPLADKDCKRWVLAVNINKTPDDAVAGQKNA